MDFNIETTTMGNQDILDILDDAPAAGAKPADVKPVDDPAKPADVKPDDKVKADDPNDLVDALLGDEPTADAKPDDKTKVDDKVKDEPKDAPPFEKLSKDFFDLNLFTLAEGETAPEIKTPEEFIARVELEKKKGAVEILENYIGRFGEDYQNAFDAIFNNGVNPKDYFSTMTKIEDYSTVDLTKEGNQERIVREGLAEEGYEAEDIDAKIQKLKDYSDLEDESKRVQKLLIKKQTQKQDQIKKDSETKLAKETQDKQQYVTTINQVLSEKLKAKEFDGIPLNPELAKEVAASLINENWQLPDGTKLTEFDVDILNLKKPENFALKAKVALILNILKKDPTLSTVKAYKASAAAKTTFSNTFAKDDKDIKPDDKAKSKTGWF